MQLGRTTPYWAFPFLFETRTLTELGSGCLHTHREVSYTGFTQRNGCGVPSRTDDFLVMSQASHPCSIPA